MKAIADTTVVNPINRLDEIRDNIEHRLNQKNKDFKVNTDNNIIDAYQLLKPSIVLGNKQFQLK